MRKYSIFAVFAALALMFVFAFGNISEAAPIAAPTPISAAYSPGQAQTLDFFRPSGTGGVTFAAAALTSPAMDVRGMEVMDLQYKVVSGNVTTVTLKLQFSNDQVDWVDAAPLASAVTTNTVDMKQVQLFGAYVRMVATGNAAGTGSIRAVGIAK